MGYWNWVDLGALTPNAPNYQASCMRQLEN